MSTKWTRSVSQVVWKDLEAWVEQLYASHGVCVRVLVGVPPPGSGLQPVVRLVGYRPLPKGEEDVVSDEYRVVNPCQQGSTEHAALQLVSALLLQLECADVLAERQQPLFA